MFLTGINKNDVLRYLGYHGGEIEGKYDELIEENAKFLLKKATPRYTYSVFEIESHNPVKLKGTNIVFESSQIQKHLENSSRCILLAATLGPEVDKSIRVKTLKDMADAVIFDSCASSGIENLCDNLTEYLEKKFEEENLYLTDRYSPGYGDFPLSAQKDICLLTGCGSKIGLFCNNAYALTPVKSITAIIGISDKPCEKYLTGCRNCRLNGDCSYRRKGVFCYE